MNRFILLSVLTIGLISCNSYSDEFLNDGTSSHDEEILLSNEDDVIIINSLDELFWYGCDSTANQEIEIPVIPQAVRAGAEKHTLYGYKTLGVRDGRANEKVMFTTEHPELGIYKNVIYIVDFCQATQSITLADGEYFVPMGSGEDAAQCGFMPNVVGEKGYTTTQIDRAITLTTWATHIKSDANGRTYDVWLPINPSSFVWNYGTVTF